MIGALRHIFQRFSLRHSYYSSRRPLHGCRVCMIDAIAAAQSTRMIAAAQLSLIYETTAGTAISQETQDLNQRTGRIRVWMKPLSTRSAHMSVVSHGIQEKGGGVRGGSERNGQPFPPLYLPDPNPFSGHSYVLPSDN